MIRHAFITGASRGIGAAIARSLAEDGWRLTLTGREAPTELAAELDAFAVAMDQTDADSVAAAFVAARTAQGSVMALVNNAGAVETAPFGKTTPELWQRMLDVNLSGPYRCCQAALPDILAAGSQGRIVNVASTAALKGYAYVSAYVAAKHGVLGLTRSLALEWAKDGIRLNCIGPGAVITEGLAGEAAKPLVDKLIDATPLGRPTSVKEVAELVAFLASPAGALMTGQLIQIDGAAHLGPGLHMLGG